MSPSEIKRAVALLGAMKGPAMTDAHVQMYTVGFFSQVSDWVGKAVIMKAIQTLTFRPSVAELWQIVQEADGRPAPDEAWAMVPKNEEDSAVWTEEMRLAAGAAWPLIVAGDLIAARKAFLDVYEREVRLARQARRPVQWSPTLGYDPTGRTVALMDAAERGRLDPEDVRRLLPPSEEVCERTRKLLEGLAAKTAMVRQ